MSISKQETVSNAKIDNNVSKAVYFFSLLNYGIFGGKNI
jgi:hypothetical protein